MGSNIKRLVSWFDENGILNYHVLRKREIENYLGADSLAQAAGINASSVRPVAGSEAWFDFKKAVEAEKGFYDENKITVKAYRGFDVGTRKKIFGDENEEIIGSIREFLSR